MATTKAPRRQTRGTEGGQRPRGWAGRQAAPTGAASGCPSLGPKPPRSRTRSRTGYSGVRTRRPASPKPSGQAGRRKGVFPPRAPRDGQPGLTSVPGGPRQGAKVALHAGNSVADPARLPEAGRRGARPPPRVGGHREAGRGGDWRSQPSRGGRRAPATYQQTLHVDGRARVSDQRLQLPLAARARRVPRLLLGGAGHFPRRRGPAHAAAAAAAGPALRLPARRLGRLGA